jgi:hypothetical protein
MPSSRAVETYRIQRVGGTRHLVAQLRNKIGYSVLFNALVSKQHIISRPSNSILGWSARKRWRSKMKTMIAALALLTLAAGPVFAQSYVSPDSPAFTVERPIGNVWGHWMTRPEP